MRDKKGFERIRRCMNCGKEIFEEEINDMYSARFCCEKCREEYIRG